MTGLQKKKIVNISEDNRKINTAICNIQKPEDINFIVLVSSKSKCEAPFRTYKLLLDGKHVNTTQDQVLLSITCICTII